VAVEILARLRKLASDPITATEPSARARAETLKKAAEILTAPETFSRGSEAVLELQTWRVMTEMMGQRQTALMRELGRELAAEGAAKKRGLPSDPARDARISSLQDRSDTVSAEIDGLVKDIARQETAYFGRLLLEVQATNRRAAATFVTFEQTASKELAYMRSIADASTSPQAAGRLREAVETMGLARGAMARLLGPELSKDLGPGVRKSQEAYARLHEAQTKEFTERLLKAYGSYYTMDSLARTKSILEIKNNTSTTILGFLPKIALLLLGAKPVPVQIVDGKAVSGSKYNDLRRALDVMSRADILAPARLPVKVLHFIANRIAPEAKATAFLRRWSVPEQRKVYVAEELSAMREYHHNPTSRFRFDGIFKRVESVHIGDIVPGLQQRDKGAEEISRGVDIQKRLKDKTLVSSKEMLLDDAAMPLVGTSGTRSSVAWPRMNESSWKTEGTGSTRPSRIGLEVDVNSSGSITRVIRAIRDGGENAMHLVFVPDNRGYKNVREAILRSGVRNSRQLAAVFSDMSHFAENFPRSNMEAQKNFKGPSSIESGDANVLIMHSAHSRGIDPPYSKKFNRFVVHLLDPHLMSESQVIQAIGRAAKGRRPVGATLEVVYYANATSSNAHPLFRGMMTYDPSVRSMFERLERNPPRRLLQRMASEGRSRIDAGDLVLELEAVESAGYSGPLNRLDVVAYRDAVRRMIETAGRMEEAQQLQGSGFFGDKPLDASSYRPLPWMPDGRAGE